MDTQVPEPSPTPETPATPPTPPVESPEIGQPTATAAPTLTPAPANGLAIAGMITGIVAFISGWVPVFGFIVAVTAVILSIFGLRRAGQKGLAITGLVTGGLGLLAALIMTTFFFIGLVIGTTHYNDLMSSDTQSQTQDTKEDAAPKSLGDDTPLGDYTLKVNSVTRDIDVSGTGAEGQYLAVNMTMKNISNKEHTVSSLPFTLNAFSYYSKMDPEHKVLYHGSARNNIELKPSLDNVKLAPGESATGNLLFEQPPEGTALNLKFLYSYMDGDKPVTTEKVYDLTQL